MKLFSGFQAKSLAGFTIWLTIGLEPASAQTPDALRPDQEAVFDQTVPAASGQKRMLPSGPLPYRAPLDLSVRGLRTTEVQGEKKAELDRQKLLKRVNDAHAAVMACIFDEQRHRRGTTAEMLARLRTAYATAEGDLKIDLGNMLIAGLAQVSGVRPSPTAPASQFKVWSFRSLQQGNDPDALCGPPIEAHPDSVLLIPMLNLLDRDELKIDRFEVVEEIRFTGSSNSFHGFDTINLHTHGLNVSPEWPSDDVFREIHPFQLKFFVYHVPADHVSGTFWYHPHKHGAAVTQVSGGMAGPLIICGQSGKEEGLDKIGVELGWKQDWRRERPPLILQQFTLFQQKPPEGADPAAPNPHPYLFRPDFYALNHINRVELGVNNPDFGGLVTWMRDHLVAITPPKSMWMNGRLIPTLNPIRTGETTRLRLIHAGIEEFWQFGIRPKDNSKPAPRIEVIAWDGIPLPEPYELTGQDFIRLSPGNRADVLMWFDAGAARPEGDTAANYEVTAKLNNLGAALPVAEFAVVAGPAAEPKFLRDYPKQQLAKILKSPPPAATASTKFETDFTRMSVDRNEPHAFDVGKFRLNGLPFPGVAKHFNLYQSAGVTLNAGGHPVHWHVNPLYLEAADRRTRGLPSGPFWTDTLLGGGREDQGRMPFEHWPGKTVVHCHILDHEDAGMMNVMEIRNPSGSPVAPLPGVLDELKLKPQVTDLLKPAWPTNQVPPANKPVTVYAFLPRTENLQECTHCVTALNSIANLRTSGGTEIRIVAVTGPNASGIEELATALRLDFQKDVLCTDPDLLVFQALALIDGNPIYNEATGLFTYPDSFAGRTLRHSSDAMHGLLVVNPDGFIVSAHRGFRAYDDIQQTRSEIEVAANVPKALDDNERRIAAMPESTPAEKAFKAQEKRNFQRFKARFEAFRP